MLEYYSVISKECQNSMIGAKVTVVDRWEMGIFKSPGCVTSVRKCPESLNNPASVAVYLCESVQGSSESHVAVFLCDRYL